MKYEELNLETVRKCCKQHSYRTNKGVVFQKCETCPLRRSRQDEKGKEITLICHYKLKLIEEELQEEYDSLLKEDIQHQLEWDNWILSQDTVD